MVAFPGRGQLTHLVKLRRRRAPHCIYFWITEQVLGPSYLAPCLCLCSPKAYTRALELEPSRLYSRMQCGSIRLTLGDYSEGLADYERWV